MRYRIVFRKFTLKNISPECRFLPNDEDCEIRLNALIENISSIEGVLDVKSDDGIILVDTDEMTKEVLQEQMKPFWSGVICYWRFVSIESC